MENLIGLLEECLANGDSGMESLYAWFLAERDVIESSVQSAKTKKIKPQKRPTPPPTEPIW